MGHNMGMCHGVSRSFTPHCLKKDRMIYQKETTFQLGSNKVKVAKETTKKAVRRKGAHPDGAALVKVIYSQRQV